MAIWRRGATPYSSPSAEGTPATASSQRQFMSYFKDTKLEEGYKYMPRISVKSLSTPLSLCYNPAQARRPDWARQETGLAYLDVRRQTPRLQEERCEQ